MANKKDLKQTIRYVCGNIAGNCIYAKSYIENIDEDKMDEVVCKIALLQVNTTDKVSVKFDKSVKDFNKDKKSYLAARKKFFSQYYAGVRAEFKSALEEIVKEINALIPQEVKDANKAALSK